MKERRHRNDILMGRAHSIMIPVPSGTHTIAMSSSGAPFGFIYLTLDMQKAWFRFSPPIHESSIGLPVSGPGFLIVYLVFCGSVNYMLRC